MAGLKKQLKDFKTIEHSIGGNEYVFVSQNGNTRKTTINDIKNFTIGTEDMGTSATTIKGAIKEHEEGINNITTQLNANANEIETVKTNYAKKTEVNNLVSNKAEKVDLDTTNTKVNKNTQELEIQKARMDTFTKLANGSTTGDAELIDGRVGADGTTYDNIGNAIRKQVSDINKNLNILNAKQLNPLNLINDVEYNNIYESWDIPSDGWSYPWVKTITRSFDNTSDTKYKNRKSLHANITFTDTTFLTQSLNLEEGKTYKVFTAVRTDDSTNGYNGKIRVAEEDFSFNNKGFTIGQWNEVEFEVTAKADNKIYLYFFGDIDIYISTILVIESGLLNNVDISDLFDSVNNLNKTLEKAYEDELIIPELIPCVVGKEIDIYYDNLLKDHNTEDIKNLKLDNTTSVTIFKDFIGWKPTTSASYANKLSINFDSMALDNNNLIKYTWFTAIDDTVGSGLSKKCLFIGDSITNYAGYISELYNLFENDVMNFESLGTKESEYTDSKGVSRKVKHEGRSNWSSKEYCTCGTFENKTNAFWNSSTSKFDFSYYVTQTGNIPDMVFLMLGTNDMRNANDETMQYFEEIVESIHAYNSNIVIFVNMCIPQYKYAFGDVKKRKNKRYELYTLLAQKWQYLYNTDNVILLPTFINLDPVYDFDTTEKPYSSLHVNNQLINNDDTHPINLGHYKMANTIYNFIKYWIKKATQ